MTKNVENEISMKMYLLGELTEAERQVLEERLMTSNECFGELSIAEDRLVDEYLMGDSQPGKGQDSMITSCVHPRDIRSFAFPDRYIDMS